MSRPPGVNAGVDYARVVARLMAGEYVKDIAADLGVSHTSISRGARRYGWGGCYRNGGRRKGSAPPREPKVKGVARKAPLVRYAGAER